MDAKKYNNIKLSIGISKALVSFLLIMLFVWLGYSIKLESFAASYVDDKYLIFLLFTFLIGLGASVFFAPINFYTGFYIEHKYELSNQTFRKWVWENFKGSLVSIVIGVPIMLLFYFTMNQFGSLWWLPFAIIMFFVSVVLSQIFPIVILPLFHKITPLDNEELKSKIDQHANDAGIKVENIYRFDMSKNTKKANAALTGLGKTKRIILGDTLIDNYSNEEIETVIAHELGHYKRKHIVKNILIGTASSFLTLFLISYLYENSLEVFGFTSITQIAALPLLALWSMLIGVIQTPLGNLLSRKYEYEADEYAVKETGLAQQFVNTLEKITDQNLGDKEPHPFVEWFFYSHPSIKNRVNAVKIFAKANNISPTVSDESSLSLQSN
ncbi:MAG: M48 family metallopeptidase [Ignavibacterium sp.]|nr:MAG: M48 family metallopeptidase [Ignavibacterium sp.]